MNEVKFAVIRKNTLLDKKYRSWDVRTRLLFLSILISENANTIGLYRWSLPSMMADFSGGGREEIVSSLETLIQAGVIKYDFELGYIYIVNFLKHNPVSNPKHALGCLRAAIQQAESPFLHDFLDSFQREVPFSECLLACFQDLAKISKYPMDRVLNGYRMGIDRESGFEKSAKPSLASIPIHGDGNGDGETKMDTLSCVDEKKRTDNENVIIEKLCLSKVKPSDMKIITALANHKGFDPETIDSLITSMKSSGLLPPFYPKNIYSRAEALFEQKAEEIRLKEAREEDQFIRMQSECAAKLGKDESFSADYLRRKFERIKSGKRIDFFDESTGNKISVSRRKATPPLNDNGQKGSETAKA